MGSSSDEVRSSSVQLVAHSQDDVFSSSRPAEDVQVDEEQTIDGIDERDLEGQDVHEIALESSSIWSENPPDTERSTASFIRHEIEVSRGSLPSSRVSTSQSHRADSVEEPKRSDLVQEIDVNLQNQLLQAREAIEDSFQQREVRHPRSVIRP